MLLEAVAVGEEETKNGRRDPGDVGNGSQAD